MMRNQIAITVHLQLCHANRAGPVCSQHQLVDATRSLLLAKTCMVTERHLHADLTGTRHAKSVNDSSVLT
jgi:hypothetical protein